MGRLHALISGARQRLARTDADGVVLFSGGMDSVAMAILLRQRGFDLVPVFMGHRSNVGNVTRKELRAAHALARPTTGRDLVVARVRRSVGCRGQGGTAGSAGHRAP